MKRAGQAAPRATTHAPGPLRRTLPADNCSEIGTQFIAEAGLLGQQLSGVVEVGSVVSRRRGHRARVQEPKLAEDLAIAGDLRTMGRSGPGLADLSRSVGEGAAGRNRHTFASRLVMAGADLLTVKELGGWRTLAMVQRYAHLAPGHLRHALQRV